MKQRTPVLNGPTQEVLYHGTTQEYHDERVRLFGKYRHDFESELHLSDSEYTAAGYAVQRAGQYSEWHNDVFHPIILVARASKINSNLKWQPDCTCDYLDPEWYRILDIELRKGKVSEETWKRLHEVKKLVLKI